MSQYIKRPFVITAVRFAPDVTKPTSNLPTGVAMVGGVANPDGTITAHWAVETQHGLVNLKPGDWVVTGIDGETYPCRDDIFRATYVAVDPYNPMLTPAEMQRRIDAIQASANVTLQERRTAQANLARAEEEIAQLKAQLDTVRGRLCRDCGQDEDAHADLVHPYVSMVARRA